GAMLTHRNMVANMQQASAWIKDQLEENKETVITALPLYHIFSLTANCLTFMKVGAENYLITNPRDMPGFVKELKNVSFTAITGVNTLFIGLMNTPGFDEIDFSKLKMTLGGGMAVQKPVAERWKKATGVPLIEAYGLTETSPAVCINPLNIAEYNGSIGLPVPSTEVSIQDENGQLLPQGESGELCVRGPQVMKGYWNREEETNTVLVEIDGETWLRTSDLAKMDEEGYFFFYDRKKDMIKYKGLQVFAREVEEVLTSHPQVKEAGVIGVPDPEVGERVKAIVVLESEARGRVAEEDITKYCAGKMAGYMVPKIIEFRGEVPKTDIGKVSRRELREEEL
ncbi:MAG: AMP-binding protein, partial [Dehalococcoidia bacterium]|nr:AMP-binding protein [Dehalococcoidia bacterium]